jgi:hypothetical protein
LRSDISFNKVVFPVFWSPGIPVLCRSTSHSLTTFFVRPSRWWSGAGDDSGEAFLNKRCLFLLWSCQFLLQLLSPLAGCGGVERGLKLMTCCSNRVGGGALVLIYVGGELASMTLCQHGGGFPTSREGALVRSSCGCSKLLGREVIHSPWFGGGPQLHIIAGRGLPSSRSLFLGGNAWRTPASGEEDAQRLICKIFFGSRVFCIKRMALSLDRRSPRDRIEKVVLKTVPDI